MTHEYNIFYEYESTRLGTYFIYICMYITNLYGLQIRNNMKYA